MFQLHHIRSENNGFFFYYTSQRAKRGVQPFYASGVSRIRDPNLAESRRSSYKGFGTKCLPRLPFLP